MARREVEYTDEFGDQHLVVLRKEGLIGDG